ncbi:hypothetical protein C2G38_2232447 [Gigaspora rosea]|uniref:Uncharacterized protein n=1 Tax=Gigaspora rosea TaxID=44941 RepID=A0A397TVJ7_9GLOM|nr:hypothetical protein C2G38_2232447 [Gigaspora rosea]
MCKLKATITWEHSRRSAPAKLFPPIFQDKNITENNDEPNMPNISHKESNIWIEISTREIEKITQIYEDKDEMLTSEVEDISHSAIDQNSKWDLRTLFNKLPLSSF